FRPYNDTRFHARPPIKEQLGVAVGYTGAGGFYFELSLDGVFVGAGLHHPAPDQLDRFRRAIDDGRRSGGFTRALGKASAAGLSRAPTAQRGGTSRVRARTFAHGRHGLVSTTAAQLDVSGTSKCASDGRLDVSGTSKCPADGSPAPRAGARALGRGPRSSHLD